MRGCIYKITNRVNGQSYIGQTKNIYRRIVEHLKCKQKNRFTNSINKYGWANFYLEIIEVVQAGDVKTLRNLLDELEIHYIKLLGTLDNGYNSTAGGEGALGYKYSEEAKKAMSERLSGMGNPFYGKSHSESTKNKLAKNGKSGKENPFYGRTHSEETRRLIGSKNSGPNNANFGKPLTPEKREILRLSKLGKPNLGCLGKKHSEERKKHMSDLLKGRALTEEHRLSISNGKKGKTPKSYWGSKMKKPIRIEVHGKVFNSLSEASQVLNIPIPTISYRLNKSNDPNYSVIRF